MKYIQKIKLQNFGRFQSLGISLDPKINILIGENEAGKSTILSAIHHVLSGSKSRIETIGIEKILNVQKVKEFLALPQKLYANLPVAFVELYFNEQNNFELNGKNNSDGVVCDGLRLTCTPDPTLSAEINEILKETTDNFPFEFYSVQFNTFQGDGYSGYKKYLRHILIDTTLVNNEHATREYIGDMYGAYAIGSERNKHQNEYRRAKDNFRDTAFEALNKRVDDYSFSLRNDSKSNLFTDLTLTQGETNIENKGKGKQCFIKTEFALKKAHGGKHVIDVALIEEPENHLSHINMKQLINRIAYSDDKQLIIATHSSLVSSRLNLKKCILLHGNSTKPVSLEDLPKDTARFFMKAPDNGILDYILSSRVILVEGDAEYILMEAFFNKIAGARLEDSNVHVISVDGTSFKRYMDIAKLLNIRTAAIRDNDGDFQSNCIDLYGDYVDPQIKIFYESDNSKRTFEICLYQINTKICDDNFKVGRKTLTVSDYMLKNKTEAALALLEKAADNLEVPTYIKDAIEWVIQ